jgi:hypothetical protein
MGNLFVPPLYAQQHDNSRNTIVYMALERIIAI